MKKKSLLAVLLLLTMLVSLLSGCSSKKEPEKEQITCIEDLAGKKIGAVTGTTFDQLAADILTDVQYEYYNTYSDLQQALESGKIDAYFADEPVMRILVAENPTNRALPPVVEDQYGFVFPKTDEGEALRDQFNEFLAGLRADGSLDELDAVWFGNDEALKVVDIDSLTGENGTLRYVTDSSYAPFSYIKDGKLVGYEVDIVARFAKEYGYALEISDTTFSGVIASISGKKSDIGSGSISIMEERKESMLFSEPHYYGGAVLVVDGGTASSNAGSEIQSLADLDGKQIAVLTGSIFDALLEKRLDDPHFFYVNTTADASLALESGKVAAYSADEPQARMMMQNYPNHRILETIEENQYSFIVGQTPRKDTLYAQMNEFTIKLREDGTLDELKSIWVGTDEEKKVVDYSGMTGENGTVTLAISTSASGAPLAYVANGQYCGYDLDIAARFCREYGYQLEIQDMSVGGMLAAVASGKADFAASGITVTEERKQSGYLFCEPDYSGGVVVVIKGEVEKEKTSRFAEILESFEKTFFREARWKLFVSGIGVTILITALSVLFGTAIGFLLFLVYRKEYRLFNGFMNLLMDLLEKTPVVVILMILFYIIFGKMNINGVIVSIIGFSLMFACGFVGTLKVGVMAVDPGQTEAARSLGFKDTHGFLRIILPQAARHFMPNYRSRIVALLKDTAIVGYVAVQDLTKVGDIVRSRTYEAFFPLIATAVIYYLLAWLLTLLVRSFEFQIDPAKRSREKILKGVKTK